MTCEGKRGVPNDTSGELRCVPFHVPDTCPPCLSPATPVLTWRQHPHRNSTYCNARACRYRGNEAVGTCKHIVQFIQDNAPSPMTVAQAHGQEQQRIKQNKDAGIVVCADYYGRSMRPA